MVKKEGRGKNEQSEVLACKKSELQPCACMWPKLKRSAVQLSTDDDALRTFNPYTFCLSTQQQPFSTYIKMSFLFGGGRPQPSSAEKIAAAEAEIDMVSDMYNRYTLHSSLVAL